MSDLNHSLRARLYQELLRLLPEEALLVEAEAMRPYECDGLSAYKALPMMVAMPGTVDELQQVMRLCHQMGVPVVARGAGTGLSGGALPLSDGLLLSLAKLNRILEIDPQACLARVQPGVTNLSISQAAVAFGLFYAPDPSSQVACSIGGNVAENSGGVHCLKYGLTVHNVVKLEVVTVEGELLSIGSAAPDSPGYDLLALMHGSEGMLGVVVEATVRLLPLPESICVLLAAFDSVDWAGQAVGDIIAAGIIPAGLEMMDNLAIRAAEDFVHTAYPVDAAAMLLCELDGGNEEVAAQVEAVRAVLKANGATEVRLATEAAERQKLWKGRKSAFPAIGRISPDYYCMDGTIPRHRLPEVLRRIGELSEEFDLRVANVFHAGDGNLHPLILYDAGVPGELEKAERLGARILEICVAVGGSITGEHGVGVEKLDAMCVQFDAPELAQFHAIKQAFDPRGLLNPGKAVPTLHRCAELGAMHVHDGHLAHPGLERF